MRVTAKKIDGRSLNANAAVEVKGNFIVLSDGTASQVFYLDSDRVIDATESVATLTAQNDVFSIAATLVKIGGGKSFKSALTVLVSKSADLTIIEETSVRRILGSNIEIVTTTTLESLDAEYNSNGASGETFVLDVGDETSAQTAAVDKYTFRMPYAFILTAVKASLNTAPTDADFIVDINEAGTTILSTKLTIDATETTSDTAATPAVISDAALAANAEISIDIDQIGSTIAGAGLKVVLIGSKS